MGADVKTQYILGSRVSRLAGTASLGPHILFVFRLLVCLFFIHSFISVLVMDRTIFLCLYESSPPIRLLLSTYHLLVRLTFLLECNRPFFSTSLFTFSKLSFGLSCCLTEDEACAASLRGRPALELRHAQCTRQGTSICHMETGTQPPHHGSKQ